MKFIFLIFLLAAPVALQALLIPITDTELAVIGGQALIGITRLTPCAGGISTPGCRPNGGDADLSFTRLRLGLEINVNANIKSLILGQYDNNNGNETSADIIMQNLSLGRVGNGDLTDPANTYNIINPYFEFAFKKNASGHDEFAGLRIGAENISGALGTYNPAGANCGGQFFQGGGPCDGGIRSFSGDLSIPTCAGFQIGTACIGINLPSEIHDTRQTGAASPLGIVRLDGFGGLTSTNAQNLSISVQNQNINYPKIGNGPQGTAQSGWWINLQDGTNFSLFQGLGGTQKQSNCFNGSLGAC